MSLRQKAEPLAHEAVALAKHIAALIEQGLSREDVLERLADPAGVGAAMIARAVERRDAGAAYLGRVMRYVEPDPAPAPSRGSALIDTDGEPYEDE